VRRAAAGTGAVSLGGPSRSRCVMPAVVARCSVVVAVAALYAAYRASLEYRSAYPCRASMVVTHAIETEVLGGTLLADKIEGINLRRLCVSQLSSRA
jgi:hypothetical protein